MFCCSQGTLLREIIQLSGGHAVETDGQMILPEHVADEDACAELNERKADKDANKDMYAHEWNRSGEEEHRRRTNKAKRDIHKKKEGAGKSDKKILGMFTKKKKK